MEKERVIKLRQIFNRVIYAIMIYLFVWNYISDASVLANAVAETTVESQTNMKQHGACDIVFFARY